MSAFTSCGHAPGSAEDRRRLRFALPLRLDHVNVYLIEDRAGMRCSQGCCPDESGGASGSRMTWGDQYGPCLFASISSVRIRAAVTYVRLTLSSSFFCASSMASVI